MVLKRLLMTALGALGLGALATGPAFADDDQIPAPRLYGDISSCAGGMLPGPSTGKGAMSYKGLLDAAFDSDANPDNGIQMDYTQNNARIITGTENNESAPLVALLNLGGCTDDVASNVERARGLYSSYVSAKKTYEDLEEPDADDTKTYNTAKTNKEDFGGDVYDSAFDQQAKLDAANKAIKAYNALVGSTGKLATLKTGMGGAASDDQGLGYDGIDVTVGRGSLDGRVRVGDADLVTAITDADRDADDPNDNETKQDGRRDTRVNRAAVAVYGSNNVAGYQAIRGNNTADSADAVTVASGDSNAFDGAGALKFVSDGLADTTPNVFEKASASITTLGHIAHELSRWETAVNTAQKEYDDAVDAGNLNTSAQQETLRRAKKGRDHVQDELDRLTRVVRSQNLEITGDQLVIRGSDNTTTDDDTTYDKERALVDAYLKSRGSVVTAAGNVRTAVTKLDTANKTLQGNLQDADDYLGQLVTLRQYELAERKAEQEEAGGDDALKSFKDAVTAAEKALTTAKGQRTAHQSLTSDPDSTVSTLLNSLLEPEMAAGKANPADDDGSALLTAISSNSAAAAEAMTDAGAAKTAADAAQTKADEVADSVAGLTGDDGSVGQNTASIATNAADIKDNREDIDQLNSDIYGTTASAHDGDAACSAGGLLNTANCNKAAIAHNAGAIADGIADLEGMVDDNADDIATNAGNIAANAENIMTNAGNIMTNAGNISMNSDNIAANAGNIEANAGHIEMNAGNIATNAGHIASNAAGIADNMAAIGANQGAIAANANSIGANASAIGRNASMIGELSEDLDVVRAGVAASMALAGMPAINGRGISIGVGSYDGESAFAVGFQIQGEQASFKVGVTSSGGETGASAGVGFNF